MRTAIAIALTATLLLSGNVFADEWLNDGIDWVKDAFKSGVEYVQENLPGWIDTVSGFFSDASPEVQEAWDILRENAAQAGKAGQEAAASAFHTILDWMDENGITDEAADALGELAEAAGVVKAELYSDIQEFISENKDLEAWDVIKQYSLEAGKISREKFEEAYKVFQDWLDSLNSEDSDKIEEALREIAKV